MADIFDFPQDARNVARADGKGADMGGEAPQTMLMRPQGVPDQVWNAVLSVDCMRRLKGMTYREIPVPNSMANFGIGVALECDETYASGWIMIGYSLKFREGLALPLALRGFRIPATARQGGRLPDSGHVLGHDDGTSQSKRFRTCIRHRHSHPKHSIRP